MKCQVCQVRDAQVKSIVCSTRCNNIRLEILRLTDKYTPTYGCENCWGDLGQGCTEQCKSEFRAGHEFAKELYALIRL